MEKKAHTWLAGIASTPAAQALARRLEKGGVLSCTGVAASAQPFLAVLLRQLFPDRPVVLVVDNRRTQEWAEQDVSTWLAAHPQGEHPASGLFYPAWEVLPHEGKLPHADVISDRVKTLLALNRDTSSLGQAPVVTTTVTALLQTTFSPEALRSRTRALRRGDQLDPLDLVEWLEDQGYEPEAQVTQRGELSLRGGILDVFPLTAPWPVRLEFFGDELDSIRLFDPTTQISRETIEETTIPPGGELGILRRLAEEAGDETETVDTATLFDHLPDNTIWLLCGPDSLDAHAEEYANQMRGQPLFIDWETIRARIASRGMTVLNLPDEGLADQAGNTSAADEESDHVPLSLPSLEAFRPLAQRPVGLQVAETQRQEFFAQMHRWLRQGLAVHVFCNNDGERQRFEEVWSELVTEQPDSSADKRPCKLHPTLHIGTLSRGFMWEDAGVVIVTDAEVFGRYKIQRPRRLKAAQAQTTRSALEIDFSDLEEGDYVVHLQHGIGRYLGLQTLPGSPRDPNPSQECLAIEYAAKDPLQEPPKLYVPVSEAHLVSKYVGAGKARPQLSSLGGTRWKKAKEQAERAVRDVAADLLTIQAARDSQPGHAFEADSHWQQEFEASFLFEETPDQLEAITAAKADMEQAKPMDRLICGDVGFGKTEVAIRAAFKAVMGGKQVAVLVPTTVLAQQHFNTFSERMADYPIRVELLSRFRTRRQQQQVARDLALGAVDIVVGTHRLVQPDIVFKDLGLVVVDEEQRFGVVHKERLKQLRTLVDVLTLSATPIPRTLYLALSGARDMSTIQTPPQDRLPVETIVTPYDERVIRDAIQRELNRGGQVFFLHNRVMTIETMARKLENLVPHARIVVGHGQMHADDLETVMTQFINGEADVLLSTTIIESGLDIPNANTIIIDRADRFGLSDLYQLRGRVGRYKHQAYAYLVIPRHAGLLTEARKRISAIRQYATLGSGFKIAMRDLEIRGAGNLLGAEQSGHITAVGFDLYCQLLKQSIATLKGEPLPKRVEVEVCLDFLSVGTGADQGAPDHSQGRATGAQVADAALPLSYIPDSRQRIGVYRKLAECNGRSGVKALEAELTDRYGRVPPQCSLLLLLTDLKVLSAERGITRLEVEDDRLMLTRHGDYVQVGGKFPRLTAKSASARLKEIRRLLMAI